MSAWVSLLAMLRAGRGTRRRATLATMAVGVIGALNAGVSLAADERLPLDRAALDAALGDKQAFTGAAGDQVDEVVAMVDALVSRYPDAAKYTPGAIL